MVHAGFLNIVNENLHPIQKSTELLID